MVRACLCLLLLILTAMPRPVAAQVDDPAVPEGFVPLFNGTNLDGWVGFEHIDPRKVQALSEEDREALYAKHADNIREHWRAEDGVLVNDGKGVYATTREQFGDFELLVDYKTVAKADSGIYLRGYPQVQIWDTTEAGGKWNIGAKKGSGGLYNNKKVGKDPLVHADKPFGEWNHFRIRMVGSRVTIHFNDKLVVNDAPLENLWERNRPVPATGPIRLQTHGGEIRWRNIFLRKIGAEEANRILNERDDSGFTPIFNGKDFTGWAGTTQNYEVVDGAIRCKAGGGSGHIHTYDKYSDFVVRLEFQLPPHGNNGLAIRYPGTGDPAYSGMCELQVLDSEHPRYAELDPRQYHGSAYGMIAAHRGYLRPTGQWNFQEVTVKGSTIKVELNGTTILDGDLAKVTDFMANRKHPGLNLESGYFGFAGHNDPVAYRNIRIKVL